MTKQMTFDEYKASWEKAFSNAGHEIRLDDEGFKDWFAVSYGHHNGPACAKCGWSCCWHCTPASKIPSCSAARKDTPDDGN